MSIFSVFIVDDHPLLLASIENFLRDQSDYLVSGSASTGELAMQAIEYNRPDLVIIDMSLPDMSGIDLIDRIQSLDDPPLIIVLTAGEEPSAVRQALAHGARGFVTKRSAATDLLDAIHAVLHGGSYVEPRIAARTIHCPKDMQSDPDVLSGRELSVIKFVAQGYCNKEISGFLNVSIKTVETYRVRAFDKLELHTRSALVRYAHRNGWLAELLH